MIVARSYSREGLQVDQATGTELGATLHRLWELGTEGVSVDWDTWTLSADALRRMTPELLSKLEINLWERPLSVNATGALSAGNYRWTLLFDGTAGRVQGCWVEVRGQTFLLPATLELATRLSAKLLETIAEGPVAVARLEWGLQRCAEKTQQLRLLGRLKTTEVVCVDHFRFDLISEDNHPTAYHSTESSDSTSEAMGALDTFPTSTERFPHTILVEMELPSAEPGAAAPEALEPTRTLPFFDHIPTSNGDEHPSTEESTPSNKSAIQGFEVHATSPRRTRRALSAAGEPRLWEIVAAEGLDACARDGVIQVGSQLKVVLPAGARQAYWMAEAARRAPPQERARFVQNPYSYLPKAAARLFDEADYSERVRGIGEAPKQSLPVQRSTRAWLPEISHLVIETQDGRLTVEPERVLNLLEALEEAIEAGIPVVLWDSMGVEATPEIVSHLRRVLEDPPDVEALQPKGRPIVLLIKENELTLEFLPQRRKRAKGLESHPVCLRAAKPHQDAAQTQLVGLWTSGEPGALLCDDMGLGKTFQAWRFAAWVAAQPIDRAEHATTVQHLSATPFADCLLVAPPSLIEGWWRELEQSLPANRFARVVWGGAGLPNRGSTTRKVGRLTDFLSTTEGPESRTAQAATNAVRPLATLREDAWNEFAPDLLVIPYDTLRSLQFAIGTIAFRLMIADEAQEVKNPNSLRSRALRAMKYDFGLCLTGTPIENSWVDLWTLCDVAVPGHLGTLTQFREQYPHDGNVQETGTRLAARLRGHLIRRVRSNTLLDLPPCHAVQPTVEMPLVQRNAYATELARGTRSTGILGLLQELGKVSLHPRPRAHFNDAIEAVEWMNESARMKLALETLRDWATLPEPVLIFLRSLQVQATLSMALEQIFGGKVPVLNGQLGFPARHRLVADFQAAAGFRILIISPDVGGAGWNLQFCSRTILLERPFNPAVEAQLVGRTWRLGQTRPVQVVAPVATHPEFDTFDLVLDQLLRDKAELASTVLCPASLDDGEIESHFRRLLPVDACTASNVESG